jgi:electron transport complex protein RnfE
MPSASAWPPSSSWLANFAMAGAARFIPYEIRIPVFILIIAALVTVVDLAFNAFLHELYLVLGIFIPLIVTNCIVLARVEAFAAKNGPRSPRSTGLMMGVGLSAASPCSAACANSIGTGTLFSGIEMIFPGTVAASRCCRPTTPASWSPSCRRAPSSSSAS